LKGKKNKDQLAVFCRLFHDYHAKLHRYAFTIVKEKEVASDIIQAIFINLWENRDSLLAETHIVGYLYKSAYTRSLNALRDNVLRKEKLRELSQRAERTSNDVKEGLAASELSLRIRQIINELPPQCRVVFEKSRMEDKRYAEIASELSISIKTVEAQIGKALKIFREKLQDYR
jgi:RNA polymerase sigma-70 factor (ECF subfamily)